MRHKDRRLRVRLGPLGDDAIIEDKVCREGDDPTDAIYLYETALSGAGQVLFAWIGDLNENGTDEAAAVYSRWEADGEGRADVTVTGGDAGEDEHHLSQCWDESFSTVYHEDDLGLTISYGDEGDCAFSPGVYPDLSDVEI